MLSFQIDARSIQFSLKAEGLYKGDLDGKLGPLSRGAIMSALALHFKQDKTSRGWDLGRALIAYQQIMMARADIETGEVDGLIGPQTLYAFEVWQNKLRDTTPPAEQVAHLPKIWPRQSDVKTYFGDVGTHQRMLDVPYPLKLSWDNSKIVERISVHELVHESAGRIFSQILATYGLEDIRRLRLDQFGGSLNVRKMRGGASWSMHSWGIAMDWDTARNEFRWGRDQASLDGPEYDRFWNIWEGEGWVSLGRERNYDWMHVQAARL